MQHIQHFRQCISIKTIQSIPSEIYYHHGQNIFRSLCELQNVWIFFGDWMCLCKTSATELLKQTEQICIDQKIMKDNCLKRLKCSGNTDCNRFRTHGRTITCHYRCVVLMMNASWNILLSSLSHISFLPFGCRHLSTYFTWNKMTAEHKVKFTVFQWNI